MTAQGNVGNDAFGFASLEPLLRPSSVAVIGASERPDNLGGVAVSLMQRFGYKGTIYPVNPGRTSVFGLDCYKSVAELPQPAQLAIIAVAADNAPAMVRECAAAGIFHGVIWAGGFAETGPAGEALQEALLTACRETGFTVMGPNCIGVINSGLGMVGSFASFLVEAEQLLPGSIGMVSQSGGIATTAQALAQRQGFGFGITISSGNEAMLTVADYIHALAKDDEIRVIAAYVEGVRDGDRFIAAVKAARDAGKPVVVLKGGLTAVAAKAAAAHTGALAGEGRVWEAVAAELGIITVESLEDLLDTVLFLSRADLKRLPRGNGVAVITFGGGSGVLSADQASRHGLELPSLQPETLAALRPIVTPIASIANPIDLTPQTYNNEKWFAHFPQVLDLIASDPGVDIVLCQFGPMAQRGLLVARVAAELRERTDKTVCHAWALPPSGALEQMQSDGCYVFEEFERAIGVLGRLAKLSRPAPSPVAPVADPFDWHTDLPDAQPGQVVSEHECHAILRRAGVATARGKLARTEAEALDVARSVGFPLAIKGISSAVTHRAAAGLLALDIADEEGVSRTWRALNARAAEHGVTLDGLYLQEMVKGGLEVIVSAITDPVFGTMVSVGSGGILTEIIEDVKLARAPLDEAGALRLIDGIKIVRAAQKLDKGADLGDLARFVAHFSQVAAAAPWERFVIEVNPVKWSARGVVAVDGLLIIEQP